MTNSGDGEDKPRQSGSRPGKRDRLVTAAAQVLHEQGVEKTSLADIARAADVPVGNVYYYFKTKDQLVEAAIDAHAQSLRQLTDALDTQHPTAPERLKALLGGWAEQRDLAARLGCPFGTLAVELDKRADGLDLAAAEVLKLLISWVEKQFREMGQADPRDLAVSLVASYQGISLLTNAFRDPGLMSAQIYRLELWIDSMS